jgi:hypothetical protein
MLERPSTLLHEILTDERQRTNEYSDVPADTVMSRAALRPTATVPPTATPLCPGPRLHYPLTSSGAGPAAAGGRQRRAVNGVPFEAIVVMPIDFLSASAVFYLFMSNTGRMSVVAVK